ncbi:aldo/keto reductase [Cyanobium sp. T1B-Tous]|uniref:aldo/keto reductase n=1 Tax=Cyanobium sp. T1B-Tous TaxID=2823721 RepID=UPI0020CEEDC8|nr:aldo/keto reductase [Cyanobium sp. T1B-Tous]MCP9805651.1 aldo/keto reductase [Cyanobium sp. T1B-Tous]
MAHPPARPPGIGVGTWAWGNQLLWGYDPSQDPVLEATFAAAVEAGLHTFDTADSYGTGRFNGRSEALLGRFVAALPPARRESLCVATKLAPFPWRLGRQGYQRAFEASKQRLGGRVDLVQLHWSTARYAPWQEGPLLDGLADLVQRGEVGALGVSNMGPRRLRAVHRRLADRGVRLSSLQVQLSLLASEPIGSGGVADVCRELEIHLIAYSPLALGLLARPLDRQTWPAGPRGALFRRLAPALVDLQAEMARIAVGQAGGLAAVALNWCRAHGAMPIPGLRRPEQVEQAAAALSWTLNLEDRARLDGLARALEARMPANPFQSD